MASRRSPTSSNQDDLFNPEVELLLPALLAVDGKILGSPVRQLAVPARRARCRLRPFAIRRVNGFETTLHSGETLKIISAKTARRIDRTMMSMNRHQRALRKSAARSIHRSGPTSWRRPPSDRKVSTFIAGATGSATGIFVPARLTWSNEKAAFSASVG